MQAIAGMRWLEHALVRKTSEAVCVSLKRSQRSDLIRALQRNIASPSKILEWIGSAGFAGL